jgi:hypothetical protein
MVNRFMTKKQYICPSMGITDLRAIRATMHAFGTASMPVDPQSAPARHHGSKSEVF